MCVLCVFGGAGVVSIQSWLRSVGRVGAEARAEVSSCESVCVYVCVMLGSLCRNTCVYVCMWGGESRRPRAGVWLGAPQ